MRVREDYRSLTGPEKAAILIMSVGEDHAARLFELMDDNEIREISQIMANLGSVSSTVVERLFIEFAEQFAQGSSLIGSMESTERLLSKVLDKERLVDIMDDIRGPAGRNTWDKLGHVNEEVLASYLKNEYPQTVAVILSKISPEQAARVLAALPEAMSMEVVMRMLRMEPVHKEVLEQIETTLRTEFMSTVGKTSKRDPHGMMAEIFNALDRGTENRFLSSLEERNRESADRIRALMFTFEDLLRIDTPGLQTLMRAVDKGRLCVALKGASEQLRENFLSGMSDRAAKLMREDMAAMGPVRLRDVDDAQAALVQLAKDLAARGEINLGEGSGGDELIY